MDRDTLVQDIMTTDVLSFHARDSVEDAIRSLVERGVGGAPVVDDEGRVVGLLTDDDLIVRDARLHMPTVIEILGGAIVLPWSKKEFEDDLQRALGGTVGDVMRARPQVCSPADTVEEVATRMHGHDLHRLPVVDDDGRLVGIVARGDILRALVSP